MTNHIAYNLEQNNLAFSDETMGLLNLDIVFLEKKKISNKLKAYFLQYIITQKISYVAVQIILQILFAKHYIPHSKTAISKRRKSYQLGCFHKLVQESNNVK